MPAPHKFTRKLHEAIGPEAADAMVDWMNQTDDRIDALRQELAEFRSEMRADFAELRQEMNALSASIDVRFAGVDAKFASVDAKFAAAEAAADRRHTEFMKWTLGFWVASLVTMVAAIAALSRLVH